MPSRASQHTFCVYHMISYSSTAVHCKTEWSQIGTHMNHMLHVLVPSMAYDEGHEGQHRKFVRIKCEIGNEATQNWKILWSFHFITIVTPSCHVYAIHSCKTHVSTPNEWAERAQRVLSVYIRSLVPYSSAYIHVRAPNAELIKHKYFGNAVEWWEMMRWLMSCGCGDNTISSNFRLDSTPFPEFRSRPEYLIRFWLIFPVVSHTPSIFFASAKIEPTEVDCVMGCLWPNRFRRNDVW